MLGDIKKLTKVLASMKLENSNFPEAVELSFHSKERAPFAMPIQQLLTIRD